MKWWHLLVAAFLAVVWAFRNERVRKDVLAAVAKERQRRELARVRANRVSTYTLKNEN